VDERAGGPLRTDLGGEIESERAHRFHRRQWIAERIGWAAMAVVLAAGLLGFLGGSGPFVERRVRSGDLELAYPAAMRFGSPEVLRLAVRPRSEEAQVAISNAYLDAVSIDAIVPPPKEARGEPDWTVFAFATTESSAPISIRISIRPERIGRLTGSIRLDDGPAIALDHWVFP
jgi:hypothetical protein